MGFSLVEMLVALVFTSILMAGMANVFRSSMGVFVSSSETISSGRRNRMAMDLLFDDLNLASTLPSTLFSYPGVDATNPPFRITPNQAYAGTDVPTAQAYTDLLDFYYDDLLPYDATVGTTLLNTSQQVSAGSELGANASFTINLRDANQASAAATLFSTYGLSVLFRSSGYAYTLATATQSGSSLSATLSTTSNFTGTGAATGATFTTGAPIGTGVVLIRPGRYVRYSIRTTALDPSAPSALTPCLFRDEVTYGNVSSSATPFATPDDSVVVAENVTGFSVLLSVDGGKNWTGGKKVDGSLDTSLTTWASLTGAAVTPASGTLNWYFQSGTVPVPKPYRDALTANTTSTPFWFREFPVLVRLDVTTRTLTKRTEYTKVAATADYKTKTQSLILVPRHSGLAYQPVSY